MHKREFLKNAGLLSASMIIHLFRDLEGMSQMKHQAIKRK